MLESIRQVLLKQYIGAIAAGMLVAEALMSLIQIATMPINSYLLNYQNFRNYERMGRGMLGGGSPAFPWYVIIGPILSAVLHFLVAWLLIRWLYFGHEPTMSEGGDDGLVGE